MTRKRKEPDLRVVEAPPMTVDQLRAWAKALVEEAIRLDAAETNEWPDSGSCADFEGRP